jgi:hypothetical protein
MFELLQMIPWPALLTFAVFLVLIVFLIYLLTLRAGLKTNGEISIGKLRISSNSGIFDAFAQSLAEYHRETQEMDKIKMEAAKEVYMIDLKLRLKGQMKTVERTLDNITHTMSNEYMQLLRNHYSNIVNTLTTPEYRAFKIMANDIYHISKTYIRDCLVENHITEKSDLELERWKREIISSLINKARIYLNEYYPGEFITPSIAEFMEAVAKIKDRKLEEPLYECFTRAANQALICEAQINNIKAACLEQHNTYVDKWAETFANINKRGKR